MFAVKIASEMWQFAEETDLYCLFCGEQINNATDEEKKIQWHSKCIRSFFKTDRMPDIDVSKSELEALVVKTVNKGLTVPGVQKKLSLHLSQEDGIPRLTMVDYPTGYILKPQSESFSVLPEAEHFVMKLALKFGIKTAPCGLVRMQNQGDETYAYITRRVDRITTSGKTKMLAMEDFCQLGQRLTQEKYKSSCEKVGKILLQYSSNPIIDSSELYMRLLYCYLTGNSDMHLKNYSLIETEPGSRRFVLSPAYDLLPVNVVMPEDTEETALPLNGKKRNLTKKDFLTFAEGLGINPAASKKIMEKYLKLEEMAIGEIDKSFMPDDMKESMAKLMQERFEKLK